MFRKKNLWVQGAREEHPCQGQFKIKADDCLYRKADDCFTDLSYGLPASLQIYAYIFLPTLVIKRSMLCTTVMLAATQKTLGK